MFKRAHIVPILMITALLLSMFPLLSIGGVAKAEAEVYTARPSINGRLHVEGTDLCDESGQAVQLRGVSTHGLTWYPDFVNENLFNQVSKDWNGNFVRLAMYSTEYSKPDKREECYALMKKGIDAAVAADMYVLVDWHVLEEGDPNAEIEESKEFFSRITSEYADCPNLLFEICNEPNGEAGWDEVVKYSTEIIPLIRSNIPESVILVGTPEWDRNLGSAVLRPIKYGNIMYVLHFYSASHHEGLRGELSSAHDAGLPVFVSECGLTESDGNGDIDFASAAEWFTYLNENKISYAVWNLSDKEETSAIFKHGFNPYGPITDDGLSVTGLWVRELIQGKDPKSIPTPADVVREGNKSRVRTWFTESLGERGKIAVYSWTKFAVIAVAAVLVGLLMEFVYHTIRSQKRLTYDDVVGANKETDKKKKRNRILSIAGLLLSICATLIYLMWRIIYSVPTQFGVIAIVCNIILLFVEILGFVESLVLFMNLFSMKDHPLPKIPDDAWPEVDIFIATYNEPEELLRKTINGCKHLKYPDTSKVHIWVCDDNRRQSMRQLAESMGVGYFDRPDNKGAKAGNLNAALARTSAPYVVTLDADMIVKSDFLLKTIPYFVDVEIREKDKPEDEKLLLGLLQTPQCFYDPDVFQHALYSERRAPNEQDFFYRTIEPAKTATNSVIYGGSNTVLSRKALNDIGGFYTESITEDFATGLLIESAGYVSLGLPEPLASGQTPHTFREHIQQRTRWGRGVIVTARKLKIWGRKNLTVAQKVNYWSSVVYWYSSIKSLVYMLSPLLFAALAIPVFNCNWLELIVFWLPMFLLQDLCLRVNSKNSISTKWSGIYETSVMAHLFIPIIQESLGFSMSKFKVTDKSKRSVTKQTDVRAMMPFIIFIALSIVGIVRIISIFDIDQFVSFFILLFWIIRNLYFLAMAIFLVDGRDSDGEVVRVIDAEIASLHKGDDTVYDGVTTLLTEHNVTLFLDECYDLAIGEKVSVTIYSNEIEVTVSGVISGINEGRSGRTVTYTVEILDFQGNELEYLQILYDRIPSLPQSLNRDFGLFSHMWQNIAHRVARTRRT